MFGGTWLPARGLEGGGAESWLGAPHMWEELSSVGFPCLGAARSAVSASSDLFFKLGESQRVLLQCAVQRVQVWLPAPCG